MKEVNFDEELCQADRHNAVGLLVSADLACIHGF